MIKEEMENVRRDLAFASSFPDEEILRYTLRRMPPSDWPVYSSSPHVGGQHILQWVSPDNRAFSFRLAESRGLPKMDLVRDHTPCLEAFHLSKRSKNIAYRIALGLASISIATLLVSGVTGMSASVTFVLCYIFMCLSIESGIIALLFLNKQRQVEKRLWPLALPQHFLFGREPIDFTKTVEKGYSPVLEAYNLARAAKYTSLVIGLALLGAAFVILFCLTIVSKPVPVIFVPCYICLSLAIEAGLVGILFDKKMREIQKQIQPRSFMESTPDQLEEVEASFANA